MDPALGGAELERLLAVLLRMLTPAAARQGSSPPTGSDHAGRPAPDGTAAASAPDGAAAAPAPDGAASRSAAPGGTTTGGFPTVTASEARALTELLAAHGIAQGQLPARLGRERSRGGGRAGGRETRGGTGRGRDEQTPPSARLYLPPQGRAVADRLWQAWQSRQARILAGLTDEERAGLATGLRGVLRGLAAQGLLAAAPPPNGQS